MKKFIALGAIVLGGAIAFQALAREPRRRMGSAVRQRMLKRMERMMAGLPEGSPPRLVMSVLPRLREQARRCPTPPGQLPSMAAADQTRCWLMPNARRVPVYARMSLSGISAFAIS